ncbi:MAG: FeoA family protein [Candidatus Brocadiia bacterium]
MFHWVSDLFPDDSRNDPSGRHAAVGCIDSTEIPLADLRGGEAIVVVIRGGRGLGARLSSMGIGPGAEIHVVSNSGRGPMIVAILGSRLALGRREAGKIIVRRVTER